MKKKNCFITNLSTRDVTLLFYFVLNKISASERFVKGDILYGWGKTRFILIKKYDFLSDAFD